MGREIEHKFLVDMSLWHPEGPGVAFRQGYLSADKARVVRVRTAGPKAYLTIKGPGISAVPNSNMKSRSRTRVSCSIICACRA